MTAHEPSPSLPECVRDVRALVAKLEAAAHARFPFVEGHPQTSEQAQQHVADAAAWAQTLGALASALEAAFRVSDGGLTQPRDVLGQPPPLLHERRCSADLLTADTKPHGVAYPPRRGLDWVEDWERIWTDIRERYLTIRWQALHVAADLSARIARMEGAAAPRFIVRGDLVTVEGPSARPVERDLKIVGREIMRHFATQGWTVRARSTMRNFLRVTLPELAPFVTPWPYGKDGPKPPGWEPDNSARYRLHGLDRDRIRVES